MSKEINKRKKIIYLTILIIGSLSIKTIFINLQRNKSKKKLTRNLQEKLGQSSKIPHILWISGNYNNILELSPSGQKNLTLLNLEKTIRSYKRILPNIQVKFLTEKVCYETISSIPIPGATKELLYNHMNNDPHGFICQIAALFIHGGYYLSSSLDVIEPFSPPPSSEIEFVAVNSIKAFTPSFLASIPHHPVLYSYLKKHILFVKGGITTSNQNNYVGELLRKAFYEVLSIQKDLSVILLKEENLKNLPESNLKSQGIGSGCDYVILNPKKKIIHFYTRFAGANPKLCQRVDETNIPYTLYISPSFTSRNELKFQRNLLHSKRMYQKYIPNIRVQVLNEALCINTIIQLPMKGAAWYLLDHYLAYRNEKNNYDLCALALLYTNGGYYLDGEVEVIEPFIISSSSSSSSSESFTSVLNPSGLLQHSFLVSSPGNDILHEMMQMYILFKRGEIQRKMQNNQKDVFGELWLLGYHRSKKRENTKFLYEKHLETIENDKETDFPNLPNKKVNENCNYVIYDDMSKRVHFYTRFEGSSDFCPDESN